MRLILSRKGFDSGTGRKPSPIFEDGTLASLPIPEKGSAVTYADVTLAGRPLGPLVEQLTGGRVRADYGVHLDPDLSQESLPRSQGWRPAFGQCSAAQGVLRRAGVGPGDLFLFFGWFREVEETPAGIRYRRGSSDQHVLFGWLQVGEVVSIPNGPIPSWARPHPHVAQPDRTSNTLYVASDELVIEGQPLTVPGAGCFRRYRPELRLTAPGATRSVWSVPRWLAPRDGRPPLGGHAAPERWREEDGELRLRSVARGQEFVLDLDDYPEAFGWLQSLLVPSRSA